ncbi:phage tail sheath C-terminal domain-containing protein [Mycolicibacterium conceptionense]|uniref:phage tail sheath C-terminal domain-containing protein n=1 Tax=Mycolicibacterium conceptionense TaxID=451644 RepID=UPI000A16429B|nr:phage tail sheath C-terminal domain-containing protein [Mycolicibacterium conceptionense]
MPVLVVPGVSVEANFDVLPPLPAAAGIVGVVGIVDRPPATPRLVGVTRVSELQDLCGPGTLASMPDAVAALSTGARELVVSAVAGGAAARASLVNSDNTPVVRLRARAAGAWANQLTVDVRTVTNATGAVVRVTLRILQNNAEVERFDDLIVEPGQPLDLFSVVNSQSNYVVAVEPGFEGDDPAPGDYPLTAAGTAEVGQDGAAGTVLMDLRLIPGASGDGVVVRISGADDEITLEVLRNGARQEIFEGLTMDPDSANHLPAVLSRQSRFVRAVPRSSLPAEARLPRATPAPVAFAGGSSPNVNAYRNAIDLLTDDPRIDLVMASFDPALETADVIAIHQALLAHALVASDAGAPRIAFGSIRAADAADLDAIRDHAAAVRNRRFVLVAPPGATGAVIGLIGRLNPEISPTFSSAQLLGIPPSRYRESELNVLLGPAVNLLVVQQRAGRGVIVLKGINTIGDQISVTRVADRCIRETKAISENFIGRLNSADAREALKQQLIATFTRLERSGALVPSTDGSDPAFIVDVYSTQQDFAQGIVRVDIAVRPVRAIDYVYATIRVKN